ncbi:MAG: tetratricopeptide repeat protein [Deltaproteobacteria bacterium]|nr:tetratricopeptide repeat protein [Deltaproteobacteria bacterium]
MASMMIRITTTVVALAFSGTVALAAGSSPMPAKDTRPGVAEYNSGVKLMKKGNYEKAQREFEAALAKNPNMAEAHNNLGYSLRKQGPQNYEEALRQYDRAIELNDKLAEAYMYRGVLYMLMGNESKALEDHRVLTGLNRKLADELQAAIASREEPQGLDGLAKSW